MPRLHDRDPIRAILNRDRPWAVYALGDLDPEHFVHTRWHVAEGGRALSMQTRHGTVSIPRAQVQRIELEHDEHFGSVTVTFRGGATVSIEWSAFLRGPFAPRAQASRCISGPLVRSPAARVTTA